MANALPVSADAPGAARPGRRERKKAALRGRILETALALFEERGFAETRVAEICERADVAEKTFFNHFPSKQHLLREVAGLSLDGLLERIAACSGEPTLGARLRRFFGEVAETSEQGGPMHRELLTELVHVAHESGTEHEQTRRLHDAFAGLVRGPGGDPAGDREVHTEMVTGAFYVLMFNWANLEGYPLRERAAAAADFLAGALASPSEPPEDPA